jgi:hypothetical protein
MMTLLMNGCQTEQEQRSRAQSHECRTPCRIKVLTDGGWEHTSTEFASWEGFKPMEGYADYSVDFFDGKHYVLKGSSPYTPPSVARPSFRNFYQDVYPNPFAKFRCTRL